MCIETEPDHDHASAHEDQGTETGQSRWPPVPQATIKFKDCLLYVWLKDKLNLDSLSTLVKEKTSWLDEVNAVYHAKYQRRSGYSATSTMRDNLTFWLAISGRFCGAILVICLIATGGYHLIFGGFTGFFAWTFLPLSLVVAIGLGRIFALDAFAHGAWNWWVKGVRKEERPGITTAEFCEHVSSELKKKDFGAVINISQHQFHQSFLCYYDKSLDRLEEALKEAEKASRKPARYNNPDHIRKKRLRHVKSGLEKAEEKRVETLIIACELAYGLLPAYAKEVAALSEEISGIKQMHENPESDELVIAIQRPLNYSFRDVVKALSKLQRSIIETEALLNSVLEKYRLSCEGRFSPLAGMDVPELESDFSESRKKWT